VNKTHKYRNKTIKKVNSADYNFFSEVYEVTKLIPFGKVTNYGAIARYLGTGRSARMVGWALNATPKDENIPAHRVVNSKGLLTGKHHFTPPTMMQNKLESEGIKVVNDKVVDFTKHLWDPSKELL